jgi:hypothetical protein
VTTANAVPQLRLMAEVRLSLPPRLPVRTPHAREPRTDLVT